MLKEEEFIEAKIDKLGTAQVGAARMTQNINGRTFFGIFCFPDKVFGIFAFFLRKIIVSVAENIADCFWYDINTLSEIINQNFSLNSLVVVRGYQKKLLDQLSIFSPFSSCGG